MSYQPFPASVAPTVPSSTGRRNPVLLVLGIVVLVAGVVVGLLLLLSASSATEDGVTGLGRAPAGCSTTLKFDQTGTFLVFYERSGTIADLDGGCPQSGRFDRADTEVPAQTLTLTDPDGRTVRITDATGVSYDTAGFEGTQIGKVAIADKGDYELTVTPDDAADVNYAIAVGKDPTATESTRRIAGFVVLGAGLLLGGLLIALGARRRRSGAATTGPTTWPVGAPPPSATWPPRAPAAPPYAGPPTSFGGPTGAPWTVAPGRIEPQPLPGGRPPASPPTWGGSAPSPQDPTRQQPAPDPFSRPPGG
jgi:hypothetical protein